MMKNDKAGMILAGAAAGAVNGLLGAGGGMILIPMLCLLTATDDSSVFSSSVAIILPICLVSLGATAIWGTVPWKESVPWLFGSAIGGFLSGKYGKKIPVQWLHKGLGLLIIYGGIRYLC